MLPLLGLLLLGCLPCAIGDKQPQAAYRPTYVHDVLRKLTAGMSEQRAQLQTTMTRLKDSESLVKELQGDLQQTQKQLKAAMDRLKDSGRVIKELRTELQSTKQDLRADVGRLQASVVTIDARSNVTQHAVQVLQKLNEVSRVSFSTSLLASGHKNVGPFNVDTNLVFRHVFNNVGNGYNPNTGVFTAPVRGIYQFNIFAYGHGGVRPTDRTGVLLFKNSKCIFVAYEHQPSHAVKASNGASVLLEANDVVYVKMWANTWIYDDGAHHSTFSGHLLFTV